MTENLFTQIDQMLTALYPTDQPGVAVIVTQNDETLFRKGYGMANLELGVKMEPHMVFRLGSITKQFTAVAILMLLEQGLLDLQDDLARFLPDYPTGGRKITVEHLLTHTSGIKSYTSMPEWLALWRKDMTLTELVDLFKDQPHEFEPGEKFNYNNSGYILLGAIIEKASGVSYADFIEQRIFKPLGMTNSLYDLTSKVVPGRVSGYFSANDGFVNAQYLSMTQPYAAGSLASSVDDLVLWEAGLTRNKLIRAETLELAYRPYTLRNGECTDYGYGWSIYEYEGMRFISHSGGINGFTTGGVRIPSEGIYVAVLCNLENPKNDPQTLAYKLAALASGHPMVEPAEIAIDPAVLDDYPGVYQINEKDERFITRDGDKLYSQRSGGIRYELFPFAPDAFMIREADTRLDFERADGVVKAMRVVRRFGPKEYCPKTNKELPAERESVLLETSQLTRLVGGYELAPGLVLDVSLADGQLAIQAPGQELLPLFAASPEAFFAKIVDVTLTWQFDEAGQVAGCMLTQGSQAFPLKRVS